MAILYNSGVVIIIIIFNLLISSYCLPMESEVEYDPVQFIKLTLAISKSTYLPLYGENRFVQNGHVMENPSTSDLRLLFGCIPLPREYKPTEDNIACEISGWSERSYENQETEVFLFVNEQQKLAVFGFRGTEPNNLEDWNMNLQFWSSESRIRNKTFSTHKGFKDRYNSISSGFEREYQEIKDDHLIVLTGHSLGAAEATIAALSTTLRTKRKPDIVITYGSPRVGEENFVALYQEVVGCGRTIRIVTAFDPVPHVPYFGYHHVCDAFMLDGGGYNIIKAHSLYHGYNSGIRKKFKNLNTINFGCDQML